jgi:hypothetical protein
VCGVTCSELRAFPDSTAGTASTARGDGQITEQAKR